MKRKQSAFIGGLQGEQKWLSLLFKLVKTASLRVKLGIGDDAAVLRLPNGQNTLITVDSLVEKVHFDLRYANPQEIGHKALAVNLSDIAAMGGKALAAVVSVGVGPKISETFFQKMYRGLLHLAHKYDVDVVGGNLTRSQNLFIDIAMLGCCKTFKTRSGARPGDVLAVTGTLGNASAGLYSLKRRGRKNTPGKLLRAQLCPIPRMTEGAYLGKHSSVTAMIDISDGLALDVSRLAQASGVGILIYGDQLPVSNQARAMATKAGLDLLHMVLAGGEDYELLFSVHKDKWRFIQRHFDMSIIPVTLIGEIKPRQYGLRILTGRVEKFLNPRGWDPFIP